jgi:autotransporter-associated beta strand protein
LRALTLGLVASVALPATALAGTDITPSNPCQSSALGGACNAHFSGGTLTLNTTSIGNDFTLDNNATNTIDIHGETATMSGKFTGTGPITFINTVSGGSVTLTNSGSTYTGDTTIGGGATLALSGTGTIATSTALHDNGTFDISATTTGAAITSLDGSGNVVLGTEPLTITNATGTFSGVISGTGMVTISASAVTSTETFTGVNTYTGSTVVSTGTLALTGTGSIANSASVSIGGTLDVSAATNPTLKSLMGGGVVSLGASTLTLSSASGTFTGIITGTGGVTLTAGNEYLTGSNTFTGVATVNGGILYVGSSTIAYNVVDNAVFGFSPTSSTTMNGVISGGGAVTVTGGGLTTINTVQTYTGATTIYSGRLALGSAGSIASSSGVNVGGIFDITGTTGATITSLSGNGSVYLGSQILTISNGAVADKFSGSVIGTGGVAVSGGTLTLSGTSTHTGNTTINNGATLALPSGSNLQYSHVVDNAGGILDVSGVAQSAVATTTTIVSLSGGGTVALGTHTLNLTGATDTFSGIIGGTGGLTVSGGSETLSGANTYTGTTTVSSGATLTLAPTGSLASASGLSVDGTFDASAPGSALSVTTLSGGGLVVMGSNALNLTNATGIYSGVIQGSGGLTVSGGTEILTGTNTYSGGTTISGGTLQIGNRAPGGSIQGDVLDNGTLAFARSDAMTFAGKITGSGAVKQIGGGTTVLTADNTYGGGTTITVGTLQIGGGGATGSIQSDVTDNGTLAFGRTDATSFGGVISGSGKLNQLSGALTLTAADTYTGTTTIAAGATLALSGAGSIANSAGVTANGTFDVSSSGAAPSIVSLSGATTGIVSLGGQTLTITNASGNFAGVIQGTGGLTLGSGTEVLSGANTYSGATTINGGTLVVNGSIASSPSVTVNSGGTLAGHGAVSSVTVASGGTLAPGSGGAGTLSVNGNVNFASGSNYLVALSSGSHSNLTATGSAALAGTLTVSSTDGTLPLGQKLTMLTATGGISGTFTLAPLPTTGAHYSSALSYDANDVFLQINLASLTPLLPSGSTFNQKSVVSGIDAAITAGDTLPAAFQNLGNLTSTELAASATQLSGEIGSDLPHAANALFTPFMNAITERISDHDLNGSSKRGEIDAWVYGFGTSDILAADANAHRLKTKGAGVVAGASWRYSSSLTLGAAISGGSSDFHLTDGLGAGTSTAIQGGLYGYMQWSRHLYSSFVAGVSMDTIKTTRTLTVDGTDVLKGKINATLVGGRYETGIEFGPITPYLAFEDQLAMLPAYSETAASGADTFALHFASRTDNNATAELGVRGIADVDFTPRWVLTPDGTLHMTGRVAWAHAFAGNSDATASFTNLVDSAFAIRHAKVSSEAALVTLGTDLEFKNGVHVGARLDSAFSQTTQRYTAIGGFGYTW